MGLDVLKPLVVLCDALTPDAKSRVNQPEMKFQSNMPPCNTITATHT